MALSVPVNGLKEGDKEPVIELFVKVKAARVWSGGRSRPAPSGRRARARRPLGAPSPNRRFPARSKFPSARRSGPLLPGGPRGPPPLAPRSPQGAPFRPPQTPRGRGGAAAARGSLPSGRLRARLEPTPRRGAGLPRTKSPGAGSGGCVPGAGTGAESVRVQIERAIRRTANKSLGESACVRLLENSFPESKCCSWRVAGPGASEAERGVLLCEPQGIQLSALCVPACV